MYFVRDLFSIDSPLMRFLGKMADLMLLNLLFLITSVPLVTVGASLTALHYACMKMAAGEESSVTRDYFRSFRQNLLQATAIWLLLAAFALLIWYDLASVWDGAGPVDTAVRALGIVACVVLAILLLHVFAVLSKFSNTVRGTLKNSVALALRHPGRTVSLFMLPFACTALTFYTATTLRWGLLAWLLIGFAGVVYFNSFLLRRTFSEIIAESAANGEET